MKKAVYRGVRDIRIEDVPMPEVPDDGLLVKVKYCGICGSDIHEYEHGPCSGIFAPGLFGHEFSGDVVEVGSAATGYQPGDRVVGTFVMGAYAEYVAGPEKWFHKLDERMSYEDGAVTEPTTVACYAVNKGAVEPGESALVVGAGPIGLLTVMALKAAGARPIYVSETTPKRQTLARDLGADEVFDPSSCDVVEEVRRRTRGRGVDVSFECVGLRPALLDSINAVRRHKRVVVEGMFSGDVTLDFNAVWQKDISLLFSLGADFGTTMPLIAEGKIPSARIVTSKIAMSEMVTRGIERLTRGRTDEVKILVSPEL